MIPIMCLPTEESPTINSTSIPPINNNSAVRKRGRKTQRAMDVESKPMSDFSTPSVNSSLATMDDLSINVRRVSEDSSSSAVSLSPRPSHHKHARSLSSVSFVHEPEVHEFIIAEQKIKDKVWYSPEELSEIRQKYKEEAQSIVQSDGEIQRGLENGVFRLVSSPKERYMRKHFPRDVVLSENANQILEYGFLCDTERLASEYRRASKESRLEALARAGGLEDALPTKESTPR